VGSLRLARDRAFIKIRAPVIVIDAPVSARRARSAPVKGSRPGRLGGRLRTEGVGGRLPGPLEGGFEGGEVAGIEVNVPAGVLPLYGSF